VREERRAKRRQRVDRARQHEDRAEQAQHLLAHHMTSPAAASSASSLRDKSASTNHAVKRVAAATKADGSQAALWKSLEYWWLANPGGDVSVFLAANKRWDSWYLNEHSSKLAAAAAIIKHDTLLSDRPASADKHVLARTQYLVAKFLFLSNRKDATISDWDATAQSYARDVPHKVRAFKWKTENERDNRFSSSILHAVAPSDDKFRAQEHQMERSRHTYLQSMKEFFLERGAVDGGSEGDRAEEQWTEVQRVWEALQAQHYQQQEHQWKAGQEKKLVWEEDRLKSLERQEKQHREVEKDVMRAKAYLAKQIKYQVGRHRRIHLADWGLHLSMQKSGVPNWVATISRLLQILGLFCKRALSKRRYSAKETYHLFC